MQRKSIVIDPRNMTPDEECLLRELLDDRSTLSFLESYNFKNYEISVLYDITPFISNKARKSNSNDALSELRYAVNLQCLGSGSQGEVMTIGILSPRSENDGLRYREETNYTKSSFVVKKEKLPHDRDERHDVIKQRNKILKLAGHLAAKKLEQIKLPNGDYALLTIQRLFKGKVLKSLFNELSKINPHKRYQEEPGVSFQYSEKFLFAISVALLTAYKEQVFDIGLIHRDLKPDNIIIDLDLERQLVHEINTVDFDIAVLQSEVDKNNVGTPGYMAPELTSEGASPSSDIYSLGVVLKMLWAGRKQTDTEIKVQKLIDGMLLDDPKDRPTPKDLLKNFHTLSLLSLYEVSTDLIEIMTDARMLALEAREKLCIKQEFHEERNVLEVAELSKVVANIFGEMFSRLNSLVQSQDPAIAKNCVEEFVATLNYKSLNQSSTSIDSLNQAVKNIISEFNKNISHIHQLINSNESNAKLVAYLQSKIEKCKTLDDFANFNAIYHRIMIKGEAIPDNHLEISSASEKEVALIQKRILYSIEKAYDIKQLQSLLADLKQKDYPFLRKKNFYTPNPIWINIVDLIQKKACLLAEADLRLIADPIREKIYLEILKLNPAKSSLSLNDDNVNLKNFLKMLTKNRQVSSKSESEDFVPKKL